MPDALQLLADDHRDVTDLFAEIASTGEPKQRRVIVNKIINALSQHASVEEELFYPAIRDRVVEGEGYITVSLEEHEKAKVQLHKLDRMKPTDPLFDPSVGELEKEVKEHIADEEMQLFPRVRAAFSADELDDLGQQLAGRKEAAPTRPHPKGCKPSEE
jgi:hemerythrin superfamily protein